MGPQASGQDIRRFLKPLHGHDRGGTFPEKSTYVYDVNGKASRNLPDHLQRRIGRRPRALDFRRSTARGNLFGWPISCRCTNRREAGKSSMSNVWKMLFFKVV